jgi:septum formation protein
MGKQIKSPKIILASSSRDRKQCFSAAHIPILVISSDFDEDSITEKDPYKLVQILSEHKANTVYMKWIQDHPTPSKLDPQIIIGADTMVVDEGHLIGKARDEQHAFEILSRLMGRIHEIITGVTIIDIQTNKRKIFFVSSKVHFQALSSAEIWDYIQVTDEFKGRAGAYSMYERASVFIDWIEGSPTNVLGIPMAQLRDITQEFGINLLNP